MGVEDKFYYDNFQAEPAFTAVPRLKAEARLLWNLRPLGQSS